MIITNVIFFYLEPYRNRPSSGSNMTYSQYIRPVSAATPCCTNSNIHSQNFNNNNDSNNIDGNNENVINVNDVGDVDICIGGKSSNHNSYSNGNNLLHNNKAALSSNNISSSSNNISLSSNNISSSSSHVMGTKSLQDSQMVFQPIVSDISTHSQSNFQCKTTKPQPIFMNRHNNNNNDVNNHTNSSSRNSSRNNNNNKSDIYVHDHDENQQNSLYDDRTGLLSSSQLSIGSHGSSHGS